VTPVPLSGTKVYLMPSCGPKQRVSSRTSEEPAKLLDRQPGITYNPAQREGLDRIMPGYSDLAVPITHDDMLALPNDLNPALARARTAS